MKNQLKLIFDSGNIRATREKLIDFFENLPLEKRKEAMEIIKYELLPARKAHILVLEKRFNGFMDVFIEPMKQKTEFIEKWVAENNDKYVGFQEVNTFQSLCTLEGYNMAINELKKEGYISDSLIYSNEKNTAIAFVNKIRHEFYQKGYYIKKPKLNDVKLICKGFRANISESTIKDSGRKV